MSLSFLDKSTVVELLRFGNILTASFSVQNTFQHFSGLPKWFVKRGEPFSKEMIRGESKFMHTKNLTLANWKDNRTVIMLYSLPDVNFAHTINFINKTIIQITDKPFVCKRRIKLPNADGPGKHYETCDLPQPLAIHKYNSYMGG